MENENENLNGGIVADEGRNTPLFDDSAGQPEEGYVTGAYGQGGEVPVQPNVNGYAAQPAPYGQPVPYGQPAYAGYAYRQPLPMPAEFAPPRGNITDAVIKTTGLTKLYGGRAVVDNVFMTVARGEIYGFIGNNGAGKTTLIRMLTGLAAPSAGSIALFGNDSYAGLKAARKKTGSVIETPAIYRNMNAVDNLKIRADLLGIKPDFGEALKAVGLDDVGNKLAKDFSMGMKQRLGIAAAILGDPELLVLDEPVNGLDPEGILEFREFLKYVNQARGITILISSHILGELYKLATAYGVIREGKLVAEFSKSALDSMSRPYVRLTVDNPVSAKRALADAGIFQTELSHNNVIRVYERISELHILVQTLTGAGVVTLSYEAVTDDSESFLISLMGGMRA